MIENVYSKENGSDNYTNRVPVAFKMPKNIRQIGKSDGNKKIYVEDYVMTYIKQISGEDYSKCKIAVLVGQYIKQDNCRNIFIQGAVDVDAIDVSNDITFTNDSWTGIYEKIKKYFVDYEIVGWFLGGPSYLLQEEDKILKAHIDNFAGQDKTLLVYDNIEREEAFLIYENNRLCKQEGYYIYYEKNEEMQTYMIDHKKSQSEEVTYDDRVAREIRTVIQNKKPVVEEDNKSVSRLMYAAGTLMAVIVLVVAAAMLSNYEQMKHMKNELNSLASNLLNVETSAPNSTQAPTGAIIQGEDLAEEGSLDVEVIPGNVKPLPDVEEVNKPETNGNSESNPTKAPAKAEATKAPQNNDSTQTQKQVKYYTVVYGDTLADISYKLYNTYTYVSKIKELNKIENENMIFEGQRLIVP